APPEQTAYASSCFLPRDDPLPLSSVPTRRSSDLHLLLEAAGRLQGAGDDRLRVARGVPADVVQGLVQVVHHPDGQDQVEVLGGQPSSVAGSAQGRSSRVRGQPRRVTPWARRASPTRGRKAAATSRWTSRVSMALQTPGRWTLALTAMRRAISRSASWWT